MSALLRVIDTGLRPARWNIAVGAALLARADRGVTPDVLRFHRYAASVIIGRNQDAAVEVDLPAARAGAVAVVRRITGGGAVVMGPGVLAFDLVTARRGTEFANLGPRLGAALVAALRRLGLAATFVAPGSVAVGRNKISGSAGRATPRALLHQATLVLDLAGAPPLALLRRRTEAGRPTADPTHRVTSLAAEGAAPARLGAIQAMLTECFCAALDRRPWAGRLAAADGGLAEVDLSGEALAQANAAGASFGDLDNRADLDLADLDLADLDLADVNRDFAPTAVSLAGPWPALAHAAACRQGSAP